MGYPVFYSDQEARSILNTDPESIQKVKSLFGAEAYQGNFLNPKFIAEQVFNNSELLDSLNTIVHPKVRIAFENWQKNQSSQIVFDEAAILFETGAFKNFDFTILVTSPLPLRIKRVMDRDKITEDQVNKRISKQWPDEKKIPLADFVIKNDEVTLVIPQILTVLKNLKK